MSDRAARSSHGARAASYEEALDADEPDMTDEEREQAKVDYRLRFCGLCGSPKFKPKWESSDPLICSGCGARIGAPNAS